MAQQQGGNETNSPGQILMKEDCDLPPAHLHPLSTNDELSVDEVIFINPLTPPLPCLTTLEQEPLVGAESERASEQGTLISDVSPDPIITSLNKDLLWVSEAASVSQNVKVQTHECSLCDKAFGTASALNKHLLSHQQDRPHVCPICQRAFKRHDHLNGHMLTHQKRKPFRCLEPGCQKSYCDAYALKRHCASQHGVYLIPSRPSSSSSSSQVPAAGDLWADCTPCLSGGPTGGNDFHSIFFSPHNDRSKPQYKCPDYAGFAGFSGYPGFAPASGFGGTGSFQEPGVGGTQSILVLDPWEQGVSKDKCEEDTGEHHPSQAVSAAPHWTPSLEPEVTAVGGAGRSPGSRALGSHCWESSLDFPISELQALEDMLSFQPSTREVSSSSSSMGGAYVAGPASPPKTEAVAVAATVPPKSRRPTIVIKHRLRQPNPKGGRQQQEPGRPQSFASLKGSPISTGPAAAQKTATPEPPDLASPGRSPKVPTPGGAEARRKRVRKRKVKETDLPAPPFPLPLHSSVAAPRRQRPRPLYLVSPSQVAMASFSTDSAPCQPSKGGKLGVVSVCENGRKAEDRGRPGPPPSESSRSQAWVSTEPGEPLAKEENQLLRKALTEQAERGEAGVGQWQDTLEVSCSVEQTPLSPLVIPVSVPVSEQKEVAASDGERAVKAASLGAEKPPMSARLSKKAHRFDLLKTLFIPPPAPPQLSPPAPVIEEGTVVGGQRCRAAGGYPSHLRSPMYLADHLLNPRFQPPPYTPPPMLSPLRRGTGLYFSTLPPSHPAPPPPSTYTATLDVADSISLVMDDTVVTIEPRINVGSRFQAEIPPLRNLLLMLYEEHPAQLVWAPWGDLSSNPKTQQRVTELLDLCCSSVLPGGGTNTELALHCLHEVQGDILAALDLLLIRGDYYTSSRTMRDYHYSGTDDWSTREKRLFRKGLIAHNKDFQLIQGVLQSKSVSQCVEYYYAMKKLKKFKLRSRGSESKEDDGASSVLESPAAPEVPLSGRGGSRRGLAKQGGAPECPNTTTSALEFTCEECGRSFEKVKSRSAHMKTHRQQEREWPAQNSYLEAEHKQEEAGLRSGSEVRWSGSGAQTGRGGP